VADRAPLPWWRRFLALPNDSRIKTFVVASIVALVSAVVVSTTAVALKPLQVANAERFRREQIEAMLRQAPGLAGLIDEVGMDALETRIVDLDAGTFAPQIDPYTFDPRAGIRRASAVARASPGSTCSAGPAGRSRCSSCPCTDPDTSRPSTATWR
jgi:Na+-transporting NADH:ubiquinone oxidoreductase subunit C